MGLTKKLLTLAATLAMVIAAASPAMAQGDAAAQYQDDEESGGSGSSGEPVSATGVVEELGPTTFMYGTHDLAGSGYVMESGVVDLSGYEGEEVAVSGTLAIEEGELEGGPPLINVESVGVSGDGQPEEPGEAVVLSGEIEALQATSFQYGTHTVVNDADGISYALQSGTVALDEFEGARATISGTLVPGYEDGQVEGGPPLVEVANVEPDENPGGQEITGSVLEVRDGSVLIEAAGGGQYDFAITEDTGFVDGLSYIPEDAPPRGPTAADLAPGLEVGVAPAGPIAESFPAQGEAASIVFLSPWYDGDGGEAVEKTIAGTITNIGDGSVTVSEDPGLGVGDPGYCDQAINFSLAEDTEILRQQNGELVAASAEDLREGHAVEVAYTEAPGQPEPAICPPQREADQIVILEANGDGEDDNDGGNRSGGNDSGDGSGGVAGLLGVTVLPDTGGELLPALGLGAALVAGGFLVRRMGR